MSFRTRLTLLTCAAVAITLVAASFAVYALARRDAYRQVDDALANRIEIIRAFQDHDPNGATQPADGSGPRIPGIQPGASGNFVRVLDRRGRAVDFRPPERHPGEPQRAAHSHFDESKLPERLRREVRAADAQIPISAAAARLARSSSERIERETLEVDGSRYRVVSGRVEGGYTVQTARPFDETEKLLGRLRVLLAAVTVGGALVGLVAAMVVTRTASTPIHRLTELAAAVRESRDLSQRVHAGGSDDLARLARSFNAMLEELERSVARQQRLVDDASHQLRTPLASIRTNMDVLLRAPQLDADVTREVLGDLSAQVDELTGLVRDLVDLASGVESSVEREPVRLDAVAEEAVRRVRSAFPKIRYETRLEPSIVHGSEERLVRMMQNLLHNAGKWSPDGAVVEVGVHGNEVHVVDHGAGVSDAEKPRIFERFHRAADARDVPGSGLGLAIVHQVAADHGGSVDVRDTPGGGATFVVHLPDAEPPAA